MYHAQHNMQAHDKHGLHEKAVAHLLTHQKPAPPSDMELSPGPEPFESGSRDGVSRASRGSVSCEQGRVNRTNKVWLGGKVEGGMAERGRQGRLESRDRPA